MFKPGDKYIHFTQYGGVNKGEVASVNYNSRCIDTVNLCVYKRATMTNTRGVSYYIDGSEGRFYKIDEEMTKEQAEKWQKSMDNFHRIKENRKAEMHEWMSKYWDKRTQTIDVPIIPSLPENI